MLDLSRLDFDKGGGVITVVTQDAVTGVVLMVAQADREAVERTIATGEMHYRSRSRGLWRKGETSGNVQRVVSLSADCDGDAVLALVEPAGPACHTGMVSCFAEPALAPDALAALDVTIAERAASVTGSGAASTSYTHRLLADRNLRLKKLGEESAELLVALADDDARRSVEESADLVYHVLVALRAIDASLADLRRELARRGAVVRTGSVPGA